MDRGTEPHGITSNQKSLMCPLKHMPTHSIITSNTHRCLTEQAAGHRPTETRRMADDMLKCENQHTLSSKWESHQRSCEGKGEE